ncbi:hypothetical protein TWF481_012201 [Arthrobotrys musiformis]|uniref:F-box domain-containing protein n=1 Tax=Arthrobotrys musiformis TaxID=47236 RepID=A0AAV9VWD0_9PEZI
MDSRGLDQHRKTNILDLPVEILQMILDCLKGHTKEYLPVALTCFQFYALTLQTRFENMAIEFDSNGLNWKPFSSNLLLESVRGQKRYPQVIDFVGYRRSNLQKHHPRNKVENIKDVFERYGNISFGHVQSLSFSSTWLRDDETEDRSKARRKTHQRLFWKSVATLLEQFPNITKLTLPVTLGLMLETQPSNSKALSQTQMEKRLRGLLSLRNLKYLCCWTCWMGFTAPPALFSLEFPAVWDLIISNSKSLECLRVEFLCLDIRICPETGKIEQVYPSRCPKRILSALETLFIQRQMFAPPSIRLDPLNLKVLYFEACPCCTLIPESGIIRVEILEVLSLVFCHDTYKMLSTIATELQSLKCLQLVELDSDITLLESSLRELPPLRALYIAILELGVQLDYTCLDKHQASIQTLVILAVTSPVWRAGTHSTLQRSYRRRSQIDFSGWKQLEELTFHCKGDLPSIYIPPSLKFLNIVDPGVQERLRKDGCYGLLKGYVTQQIHNTGTTEWSLRAVVINWRLSVPHDIGPDLELLEPIPNPRRELRGKARLPILSVKKLDRQEGMRKFLGTSIFRPGQGARTWIDDMAVNVNANANVNANVNGRTEAELDAAEGIAILYPNRPENTASETTAPSDPEEGLRRLAAAAATAAATAAGEDEDPAPETYSPPSPPPPPPKKRKRVKAIYSSAKQIKARKLRKLGIPTTKPNIPRTRFQGG